VPLSLHSATTTVAFRSPWTQEFADDGIGLGAPNRIQPERNRSFQPRIDPLPRVDGRGDQRRIAPGRRARGRRLITRR
jgi:hypothetical protein